MIRDVDFIRPLGGGATSRRRFVNAAAFPSIRMDRVDSIAAAAAAADTAKQKQQRVSLAAASRASERRRRPAQPLANQPASKVKYPLCLTLYHYLVGCFLLPSLRPDKAIFAMSSTNPFAGSSDDDDDDNDEVPPLPTDAAGGEGGKPDASSANPFDFDVDFNKVAARRQRARAAKENAKDDAVKPILPGIDADDGDGTGLQQQGIQSSDGQRRRPNIIAHRSKTTGDVPSSAQQQQQQQRRGFFGFSKNKDVAVDAAASAEETVEELRGPFAVGKRRLSVWPYDDYHLIQKAYYERLENDNDDIKTEKKEADTPREASSVPVFSRPVDPPDIPTAVQGLSLTEFESKAEARSIAIVSTWLFDAGLIDELLVNGGMSAWAIRSTDDKSVSSVQTSEGVEVGQHGYPIEGSTKMDKEISKLRNSTNRQLALINARLNDGVAATGSEVQELVNAVIATKDDIGRLRELSTYVSNAGDVDQANQFMLTKYPKLKQAINARRNLARCFRELDFFSHIPSTCDRLREELQSCEWTAHEWSTLRSVCREHVELEIFLVEAEAGMKKRLEEDEKEEEEEEGKKRKLRTARKFGKGSFGKGKAVNFNRELIDRFLREHVENVWELGDEIRIRIMSGIGQSFEMALNNPAGYV